MSIFIKTKRLNLRELKVSDACKLADICNQQHILRWMHDWKMTERQLEGLIKYSQQAYATINIKERYVVLGIEKDNELIGVVGIGPKPEINYEVEIFYYISERYANSGYTTEAVKAILWWAFEVVQAEYVVAIVQPGNKSSQRVIEKSGFIQGDTRLVNHVGKEIPFYYYRLYNIEHIPDPEWNFNCKAEEMGGFFDARADGYDSHMLKDVTDIEDYKLAVSTIPEGIDEINILDLGCGTGIELQYIFERVPNARITCIDLSEKMLEKLRSKYQSKTKQIETIYGSYLDWKYPLEFYDYVISSVTLHHFMEDIKLGIYKNIISSLKPGGLYIESDFIVDSMMMKQYQARYIRITKELADKRNSGYYHIDIPFTVEIQKELLLRAGFSNVSVFHEDIKPSGSNAVLIARK